MAIEQIPERGRLADRAGDELGIALHAGHPDYNVGPRKGFPPSPAICDSADDGMAERTKRCAAGAPISVSLGSGSPG